MDLSTQNGLGTAIFTTNPVASTITHGGIVVNLDGSGAVVSATFDSHGAALVISRLLPGTYGVALSDQDITALWSSYP